MISLIHPKTFLWIRTQTRTLHVPINPDQIRPNATVPDAKRCVGQPEFWINLPLVVITRSHFQIRIQNTEKGPSQSQSQKIIGLYPLCLLARLLSLRFHAWYWVPSFVLSNTTRIWLLFTPSIALHSVHFVQYILPRNRTSSDIS